MDIKAIYDVAIGAIKDPSISVSIDGENHTFSGNAAIYFAVGMLAGMRVADNGVESNLQITLDKDH